AKSTGLFGSFTGVGILRSSDGGQQWDLAAGGDLQSETPHPFVGMCVTHLLVDPRNPQVLLASVMNNPIPLFKHQGIYRSSDAGVTWSRVLAPQLLGSLDLVHDSTRQTYFALLGQGGLFMSIDQGLHWVALPALSNFGRGETALAVRDGVLWALIQAE